MFYIQCVKSQALVRKWPFRYAKLSTLIYECTKRVLMKSWLFIAGVSSHPFNCSLITICDVIELCYQYVCVIFFFYWQLYWLSIRYIIYFRYCLVFTCNRYATFQKAEKHRRKETSWYCHTAALPGSLCTLLSGMHLAAFTFM